MGVGEAESQPEERLVLQKSCDVAPQTKKSKQTFPLPVIFLHRTTRCQDVSLLASVPAVGGSTPSSCCPVLVHQGGEAARLTDQDDLSEASKPDPHLWHLGSRGDADDDASRSSLRRHHDDKCDAPDHGHVHWPSKQGDREARGIREVKPVKLNEQLESFSAPEQKAAKKQTRLVARSWPGAEAGRGEEGKQEEA